MRSFLAVFFAGVAAASAAVSPLLIVENTLLRSPALANSVAPQLAANSRGDVALAWIEPVDAKNIPTFAVKVAVRRAGEPAWSEPCAIQTSGDVSPNSAEPPQLALRDDGALFASWPVSEPAGGALVSRSRDFGATWERPVPLEPATGLVERVALTLLPDGNCLAAWLDGRDYAASKTTALRSRILFSTTDGVVVDRRVCDCCPTDLASFPDGSALAVYRGRSDDELRDICVARFKNGAWSSPTPLSREGWKLAGCPVNGPAISAAGARVVAAWPSGAEGELRVYASISATAGEPFLVAARVDDGHPLGDVAVAQLRSGDAFVSWVEKSQTLAEAYILLRRISADGSLSVPVRLAAVSASRTRGIPRLSVTHEEPSGAAELLLTYTQSDGAVTHIATRLLQIQPPAADDRGCARCPPAETRGSPMHGHILAVDTTKGRVRVKHDEIPGLMPAMTMWFRVDPKDLRVLENGAEIYGRIEQTDEGWRLFDARPVAAKKP